MREIELKFKVKDKDILLKKLKSLNCELSEPLYQNDSIYVSDLGSTESVEGSIWLRVRKENEKVELNLKKQSKKLEESKEIEFEVNSYEKANEFLETLGYKKWVEVNKTRLFTKYDKYNLCIDDVDRLGSFIEIEILVNDNDEKDYIEELLSVAAYLDLKEEDIVKSHYDTMISLLDN